MFGKNNKLKPEYSTGDILKVTNIFATFQGEGPYTGYPSIFIRLSGCNLACEFCDTEFDEYEQLTVKEIINRGYDVFKEFSENSESKPLIVITGGEPMRQNISNLCSELIHAGHTVQIETNGTLISPNLPKDVKIVCSPKMSNGQYFKIRQDILNQTIAIKFIISTEKYCDIDDVGQGEIPVYVQPMDEYDVIKNSNNLKLAMKIAMKHNAILSLQTHKIIGIE